MASLNLSVHGASIKSSYQSVLAAQLPASPVSKTYASWALFTVQAPLMNAFQETAIKESILKVQSTGDGELNDLINEFSDGRVQFAFVKVRDANSGLPKFVLISWCGDGVPERLKGYHSSHMSTVSKVLSGYHINITARSEDDLDPERVIQRVADSSGAKYSFATSAPAPVLTNTQSPAPPSAQSHPESRLEHVSTASGDKAQERHKATMDGLHWKSGNDPMSIPLSEGTLKGGYQPVGKVNIAAIRARSQGVGDDRPTPVKGVYEPIGRVDIAAIKAQAQLGADSSDTGDYSSLDTLSHVAKSSGRALPDDPAIKSMKHISKTFVGTKPPVPVPLGFATSQGSTVPVVGIASRTFANERGKTPAQIWAEKRAKNDAHDKPISAPVADDSSVAQGQWKSGYKGKSWAPVQTTSFGRSLAAENDAFASAEKTAEVDPSTGDTPLLVAPEQHGGEHEPRDKFVSPDEATTTPEPADSSIPECSDISRGRHRDNQTNEHVLARPMQSSQVLTRLSEKMGDSLTLNEASIASNPALVMKSTQVQQASAVIGDDSTRSLTLDEAAAESEMAVKDILTTTLPGPDTVHASNSPAAGNRARVRYDYDRAEDNEISLVVHETITSLEMVDEDWWFGTNSKGERGLFPSNYVELLPDDVETIHTVAPIVSRDTTTSPAPSSGQRPGHPTATALFDYEPAEDNELGFFEGAIISNLEFPDDDWWYGSLNGKSGLFPANYVQLTMS